MDRLSIYPSGDLYANNYNFQFVSILIMRGSILFAVLLVYLILQNLVLNKCCPEKCNAGN